MSTYAEHLPGLLPTWLRGTWGEGFARACGAAADVCLAAAKDAVRAGFVSLAPDDALPYLLADASLEGLPGETADAQRARVAIVFDVWQAAGTYPGLTRALAQLGLTGTFRRWPEFAPDLPPDRHAERWATWLCTITAHPYTGDGTWGDAGTWDDGGVWDLSATVGDVARMRRLFRAQMNARDRGFLRFVLVGGVDFWGPDTPWDNGTWTDTSPPTHTDIEV